LGLDQAGAETITHEWPLTLNLVLVQVNPTPSKPNPTFLDYWKEHSIEILLGVQVGQIETAQHEPDFIT